MGWITGLSSRPANTLQQGYLVFVSKEKQSTESTKPTLLPPQPPNTQLPQAPLFPLLPSTFDVSTTFDLFVFFIRFRDTKKLRKKNKNPAICLKMWLRHCLYTVWEAIIPFPINCGKPESFPSMKQ